ncbi:prepilin-type N-terminal cleavage/methylation domain-containing protein [Geopsychrobacter electrodiphilus]|uniref:prepilin-type N-terminal cleavage/methylation domain-containing protein n=1 Tax=Geopsychrobacter electrodiphilus TaxID=225196 RepID=UPI000367CF68
MKNQKGFTLIELVVVIVILGILAAVAVPKFVDLTADARLANAKAVAGTLGSSSAINYAAALVKGAVIGTTTPSKTGSGVVDTLAAACTDATATALMDTGATFATGTGNYTVSGTGTLTNIGDKATCTIVYNDDAAATADFVVIGAK